MTRFRLLVSAIIILDTALFAALVPLLPGFSDEFGLSSTGAGLLVAAYAAGALLGAIPGGLVAARFGPKSATIGGLVVVSIGCVGFAFGNSALELGLARTVQGVGGMFLWAGVLAWLVAKTPRDRRGEMLGAALGVAIFGALFGPVLGALASWIGVDVTFGAVALANLLMVLLVLRTPGALPETELFVISLRTFQYRVFGRLLWLTLLSAGLFGTIAVLVPLRLGAAGWGAAAIGAVFMVSAAVEMVMAPFIGRFSDRRGRQLPMRLGLAASCGLMIGLALADRVAVVAVLTVAVGLALAVLLVPTTALISDEAERVGLAQGVAFGLANAAWAAGTVIGPTAAGGIADLSDDAVPLVIGATLAGATILLIRARRSFGLAQSAGPDR